MRKRNSLTMMIGTAPSKAEMGMLFGERVVDGVWQVGCEVWLERGGNVRHEGRIDVG
jgi:hypothetical protein